MKIRIYSNGMIETRDLNAGVNRPPHPPRIYRGQIHFEKEIKNLNENLKMLLMEISASRSAT